MKRRLSSGKALKTGRILLQHEGDDDGEEEEKPTATATAQATTTAAAAAAATGGTQRKGLSNEQLSAMYANAIKLCAQNKVTP
jgi:hypothetical protein